MTFDLNFFSSLKAPHPKIFVTNFLMNSSNTAQGITFYAIADI